MGGISFPVDYLLRRPAARSWLPLAGGALWRFQPRTLFRGARRIWVRAVDPQIRTYLREAEKAEALADSPFADVLTRAQFRALAEEWRSMARRAGWDGKPLGSPAA